MKIKKTLISIITLLAMALVTLFSACKGSFAMTDFIVEGSTLKTEYVVGEEVDLSGLKMYATYTDGTEKDVALTEVEVRLDDEVLSGDYSKITESAGNKKLSFHYEDFKKSFNIVVRASSVATKYVVDVTMDTTNVKTSYEIGDTLDLSGLTVTATYSDNTTAPIALENVKIYLSEEDVTSNLTKVTATKGVKAIYVWYEGHKTENFVQIEVIDPIVSLKVVTEGAKLSYKVNETLNLANVNVYAVTKAGEETKVTEGISYSINGNAIANGDALTNVGEQTVTVAYESYETTYKITVANYVTAVSVNSENLPDYEEGATIDVSLVSVEVVYANGDDETLSLTSDGVACTDANGNAIVWENITALAGDKTINVSYQGVSASFVLTVVSTEDALESLTVSSNSTVTTFTAGGEVSLDGLAITAVYKEELSEEDETISIADFAAKGVKIVLGSEDVSENLNKIAQVTKLGGSTVEVGVYYKGKTASFNVTVENTAQSLTVDASNVTTTYKYGSQDISFENLVIKAMGVYGGEQTVALSNVEIWHADANVTADITAITNAVGEQTVTVKYLGKEDTFTVTVNDYMTALVASGVTEFTVDVFGTPAFDGLVLTANYASGASEEIALADATNNADTQSPGVKTVAFVYEGFQATVTLNVKNVLNSIYVVAASVPENVAFGTEVTGLLGLQVYGKYAYGEDSIIKIVNSYKTNFVAGVSFKVGDVQMYDIVETTEITSVAGEREITLLYIYEGNEFSVTFTLLVNDEVFQLASYDESSTWIQYNASITNMSDAEEDEGDFFVSENKDYIVGDDNEFAYVPTAMWYDFDTNTNKTLDRLPVASTVYILGDDGEYHVLTRSATSIVGVYEHSYNGTKYLTEYSEDNQYRFFDGVAVGKYFKISILPAEEYKNIGGESFTEADAVSIIFRVVDGFNVNYAKQLCVLDNTQSEWNAIKAELGLTNVNPKSVVLHTNITITDGDLPKAFTYTLPDNYPIYYKDNATGTVYTPEELPEELGGPLTRTFFYDTLDGSFINLYEYTIADGEDFAIYGNFFNIDASRLPMVAAFEASGIGGSYYGSDFSNMTLFLIGGNADTNGDTDEHFRFENLALKGNANIYDVSVDKSTTGCVTTDALVFAGGAIMVKAERATTEMENVRANTFFIGYFPSDNATVNFNKTKCYDSFQNAMFIWETVTVDVKQSYFKRAGGPVMILSHVDPKNNTTVGYPVVNVDDATVMESYVTGSETWFKTVNAGSVISQFQALDQIFNAYGKSIFNAEGKMNIVGISIAGGITNALEVVGMVETQGYLQYGTKGTLDRLNTGSIGMYVKGALAQAAAYGQVGVTFNVGTCVYAVDAQYQPQPINADAQANPYALAGEFSHVGVNYGGLGILFGYHTKTAA